VAAAAAIEAEAISAAAGMPRAPDLVVEEALTH
jgi:hypothetical protein